MHSCSQNHFLLVRQQKTKKMPVWNSHCSRSVFVSATAALAGRTIRLWCHCILAVVDLSSLRSLSSVGEHFVADKPFVNEMALSDKVSHYYYWRWCTYGIIWTAVLMSCNVFRILFTNHHDKRTIVAFSHSSSSPSSINASFSLVGSGFKSDLNFKRNFVRFKKVARVFVSSKVIFCLLSPTVRSILGLK